MNYLDAKIVQCTNFVMRSFEVYKLSNFINS